MVTRDGFRKAANPASKSGPARTAAIMALGGYTSPIRMKRIFAGLDRRFPRVGCALTYKNSFQLLVATILSAQCTDNRVNLVTPELFRKYPTPQAFAALPPEALEPDIYSTGFFRSKAKNIVAMSKKIRGIYFTPPPQQVVV